MIDINELRRLAQEAMHPVTKGRWMRLFGERTVYDRMEDGCRGIPVVSTPVSPPFPFEAACLDFIAAANPAVTIELLDRLEAAEKDITIKEEVIDSLAVVVKRLDAQCDAAEAEAIEQSRLNGMGSEREAALMAKLEAAEKERDECNRRRLEAADHFAAQTALMKEQLETLRAKIEAMEKQEPLDAGSDVFRSAFEAALKAGNWPATRQGDGYRSPTPQIAWRIAFSTVNRLKLYLSPGAKGETK